MLIAGKISRDSQHYPVKSLFPLSHGAKGPISTMNAGPSLLCLLTFFSKAYYNEKGPVIT
jgi:hypothetical protein